MIAHVLMVKINSGASRGTCTAYVPAIVVYVLMG